MEQEIRWSDSRDTGSYRLPGPEHLGRWAAVAMFVSLLLHVMVFFALDHVKIALGIQQREEISTQPVNVRQIEVRPYEPQNALPPEETVTPPDESAALLEEVDLLDLLPEDVEVDIAPNILDPEYALKMSNPLAEGDLDAVDSAVSTEIDMEADLPDFGRMEEDLKPAAIGQITVDPGAVQVDDGKMTDFTDELIKQGNNGLVENGKLDGIESLDDLLDLPPNLLLSKKTLLPSDLIFEFNRSELRESAKIGLMKLALLIDKNPNLYCWIEGHTDLIGGEETNLVLSRKRAEAVKAYLVESMRMDPDRIITRGYGKSQPLITSGDADAQAPNRRVEIKMRKTPPGDEPIKITPKAEPVPTAKPVPEEKPAPEVKPAEPEPPKAILVKPNLKAIPVEEPEPPKAQIVVPRAQPVEISPRAPRALPVEP
ncbi:OmpA family protein [Luteolibacter algae]|uniref:OmpA family protein n=1 Tax=Luteolibacter algae TaxID=454151 RepID=A0ABW5D2Q4_9BACT